MFGRLKMISKLKRTIPNIRTYSTSLSHSSYLIRSINSTQKIRSISYSSIPKFLFRASRLPTTFIGVGAGTITYINYKVHEATKDFVPDWLKDAFTEAGTYMDRARENGSQLFDDAENMFSTLFSATEPPSTINNNDNQSNQSNYSNGPNPYDNSVPPVYNGMDYDDEDDDDEDDINLIRNKGASNFSPLIKKLIEVRNVLKLVGDESLDLPSIVVVGSQSSGKSSVLEAVVGKEFLPKGNNMVTRRPIELTLINCPDLKQDYGILPQVSDTKIFDFNQIRKQLTKLNLSVPISECVSNIPIELKIYSSSVPDLTLIDLPGYIQIPTIDQPPMLKDSIGKLCQKYIDGNNLILAICPADVDLANSEALMQARKVDPKGNRTIGVITKLDLISSKLGVSVLENRDYPLKLGYIGIVSNNKDYFNSHPTFKHRNLRVGIDTLRNNLIQVLEQRMVRNLMGLHDKVQNELEEVKYQYKVEYNDRLISSDSYLVDTMDLLKSRFKQFAGKFGKHQIRDQINLALEQKVLDVCARVYWSDPTLQHLPNYSIDNVTLNLKLDRASALLTKCGVGKLSTQLVIDVIMRHLDTISRVEPFIYHDDTRRKIIQLANHIVKSRYKATVDQVENTIKPYKYEVECNQLEWDDARIKTIDLLKKEIGMCDRALGQIKQTVGTKKLKEAVNYINEKEIDSTNLPLDQQSPITELNEPPHSAKLLSKANEAIWLRNRRTALKFRLMLTKSRHCKTPHHATCPEIYLQMVGTKLTTSAVMFIQVELLNELFFQFPRDIDSAFLYNQEMQAKRDEFAKQNPKIKSQLELRGRKLNLQQAMDQLEFLVRNFKEI